MRFPVFDISIYFNKYNFQQAFYSRNNAILLSNFESIPYTKTIYHGICYIFQSLYLFVLIVLFPVFQLIYFLNPSLKMFNYYFGASIETLCY